jgi:hypothetical protein
LDRNPTGRKINLPLGKTEEAKVAADWSGTGLRPAASVAMIVTLDWLHGGMKTLAVVSILALLTISGAAYTDQIASDQQTAQRAN